MELPSFSAFACKALLDFLGGAETVTQPSARWVGLAWGTPTYTGGSEIDASFGYSRQTCLFAEAASPEGSMSNSAAMTWLSFSSACSILGVHLWDAYSGGSMLIYGTLRTARTLNAGDSFVISAGQLSITLA